MLRGALLGCLLALACCSSALAALPIAPGLLVARVRELPGFGPASTRTKATTSAPEWTHGELEGTWTAQQQEASALTGWGFVEGVRELVRARRRGAVSEAAVLATPAAAEAELHYDFAVSERALAREPGFASFPVPGIPGALGIGNLPRRGGAADGDGNVFFVTGRCLLVIGDGVAGARTQADEDRAPIAAALAVYRRARRACA